MIHVETLGCQRPINCFLVKARIDVIARLKSESSATPQLREWGLPLLRTPPPHSLVTRP